ncbi:MAG: replicative DNA helicase [Gemmatales bacterium]
MSDPNALMATRVPPHSLEAERCVLGSMLRDARIIPDVQLVLRPEHTDENFYSDAHRRIYRAINHLQAKTHSVDLVVLSNELHATGEIQDVGGYQYLAQVYDETPTAANATYYAQIVRDKAIIRYLIYTGTDIARNAADQIAPATELLEAAERKIMSIAEWGVAGETISMSKAVSEAFDRMDARAKREGGGDVSGLPSGYVDLDNITAGLQDSELIIIAARPSVGKTAITLNIMRNVAVDYDMPVFYASLEQSRIELAERLLCCEAKVDSQKLRKNILSTDEHRDIVDAGSRLSQSKIFIDDSPGQNMIRIAANARRLKLKHDIKLIVVDYLQLIEPDNRKDSRQEQVAAISRRLKFLAKELKIPVIACAQLNRGVENRTEAEPRLSDLRESGSIEQDADTVMLLHRPKDPQTGLDADGVLEIIIAKQRNGPVGKLTLAHIKQHMRFTNYAGGLAPY